MRAVVVDPAEPNRLVLQEVAPPSPTASQAVVRVAALSLNLGEVRGAMAAAPGHRPGWDLAGTVEQAAADGSGPAVGARVVGVVNSGAWAELVAVPSNSLAALPDNVSFAQAATLPVAGLTAWHAVGRGSGLLARSVLVTGASGGVGHFACQLAHLAGARVVALIRQPTYTDLVKAANADEVVVSEDGAAARQFGPYRLIIESVGGQVLANVLGMLGPDGVCVSFGASSGAEVTFNVSSLFRAGRASLYGLAVFNELMREPASVGLGRLASLVAEERLRPHISVEAPWTEIGTIARQLLDRRIPGKAVLHIMPSAG